MVATIHTYLEELAKKMRAGEVPVKEFAITKGLNKAPHEYPDAKAQPHLQVALAMMKAGKPVNVGDHIEYVICEKEGVKAAAERAFHPDDVERSEGELKVDVEWYLTQQILPPIARLCEPIEGTSLAILAERLGLDKSRFAGSGGGVSGLLGGDDAEAWGFTPACKMDDAERFAACAPLRMRCTKCQVGPIDRCPCRCLWPCPRLSSPLASLSSPFFNSTLFPKHIRPYPTWVPTGGGGLPRRVQRRRHRAAPLGPPLPQRRLPGPVLGRAQRRLVLRAALQQGDPHDPRAPEAVLRLLARLRRRRLRPPHPPAVLAGHRLPGPGLPRPRADGVRGEGAAHPAQGPFPLRCLVLLPSRLLILSVRTCG